MQELTYARPATVEDAVRLLQEDGARGLAGGTDLVPQLREGRRHASRIVDLKHVPELTAILRRPDGGWRIGAAASITNLGRHAALLAEHGALVRSARLIGSLQVQARASLGGNLANAAPSADAVPLVCALEADLTLAGPHGRRTVPATAFATGPGRTVLAAGEMIVSIDLAPLPPRSAACYMRFTPRREMDIAVAGSGAVVRLDGDGRIAGARIVLASVAPTPLTATAAAAVLLGERPSAALFAEAGARPAREARPISDTRGSAEYRRELARVLTYRALAQCAQELGSSLT